LEDDRGSTRVNRLEILPQVEVNNMDNQQPIVAQNLNLNLNELPAGNEEGKLPDDSLGTETKIEQKHKNAITWNNRRKELIRYLQTFIGLLMILTACLLQIQIFQRTSVFRD